MAESRGVTEAMWEVLKEAAPADLGTPEMMTALAEKGVEAKIPSVSASMSSLVNNASRPGVVRVSAGRYAYRPGAESVPPLGQGARKPNHQDALVDYFTKRGAGVASTREIAETTGMTTKQVGQAFYYLSTKDPRFTKPKAGVFAYDPTAKSGDVSFGSNGVFAPVLEAIPDAAFSEVGMNVVGRTQDGHRLAIDEKGTAWVIRVAMDARMV